MMMTVVMNEEALKEKIVSALETVEKGTRARTFPREKIPALVEAVSARPFGHMTGDGGHIAKRYRYRADTTYLNLAWYTQSGQKRVSISAHRGYAQKVAYGASASLSIETGEKWEAFSRVFPDRAQKIGAWLDTRKIREALKGLPALPVGLIKVQQITRENAICLMKGIGARTYATYVGTPSGWVKVPYHKEEMQRSPWLYLKDAGFPIPRMKRDRKWNDELAAYVAMHVLGGETI